MKKNIIATILGATLAITVALIFTPEATETLRFNLSGSSAQDKAEVEAILVQFNKQLGGFFSSGGDLRDLGKFPAHNLIKRRMVQEINQWSAEGKTLAYDKMGIEYKSFEFINKDRAVVVANEVWAFLLRPKNIPTVGKRERPKGSGINIQVRYIMTRTQEGWKVQEFNVYPSDEALPPLSEIWRS